MAFLVICGFAIIVIVAFASGQQKAKLQREQRDALNDIRDGADKS